MISYISNSVPAFVYQEVADRLSQCPTYMDHPVNCLCDDVTKCKKRVKHVNIDDFAMLPLKNYAEISQKLDKMKMLEKLLPKKVKQDNIYVFLTISPSPDIDFLDYLPKFKKFLGTTLFSDYCAVIEQRGNSPETLGQGFHSHVLFKRRTPLSEGLPPTDLKRKLRDIWRKFTMVTNPQVFNIQFIPEESAPGKLDYMLSTKNGKGKKLKQDYDVEFRKLHDLPSYYGNEKILL